MMFVLVLRPPRRLCDSLLDALRPHDSAADSAHVIAKLPQRLVRLIQAVSDVDDAVLAEAVGRHHLDVKLGEIPVERLDGTLDDFDLKCFSTILVLRI